MAKSVEPGLIEVVVDREVEVLRAGFGKHVLAAGASPRDLFESLSR